MADSPLARFGQGDNCHCEDPRWVFTVHVAGDLVYEVWMDTSNPDVHDGDWVKRIAEQQGELFSKACDEGEDALMMLKCPGCGGADVAANSEAARDQGAALWREDMIRMTAAEHGVTAATLRKCQECGEFVLVLMTGNTQGPKSCAEHTT